MRLLWAFLLLILGCAHRVPSPEPLPLEYLDTNTPTLRECIKTRGDIACVSWTDYTD